MENTDERTLGELSDDELLMRGVIGEDAGLLFLDCFLTDLFRPRGDWQPIAN